MPLGDPVDAALLIAAEEAGLDPALERARRERLEAVPFDAGRRFMATLHDRSGETVLYAKGAPEALLPRCDLADVEAVRNAVDRLASRGERVLLFAARDGVAPGETASSVNDLRLLGIVGMIDPPRAGGRRGGGLPAGGRARSDGHRRPSAPQRPPWLLSSESGGRRSSSRDR